MLATDVDGVYEAYGTPEACRLGEVRAAALVPDRYAAGSMGPKVAAVRRFVAATGGGAAIGGLPDLAGLVAGSAGTQVSS